MSERLTDAALENLDAFLCAGGKLNNGIRDYLRVALAELRDRRARDLTAKDREALKHARSFVAADLCGEEGCQSSACERNARALALIDRLVAGEGK